MFWFLGSVDLFGFRGYMPIEAYVIFDEITASCALSNGVMMAHFIHKVAKGKRSESQALTKAASKVTVVLIWLNFVGFITLGVLDDTRYEVYEGLKCIGGALILVGFTIVSTYFALQIKRMLMQTSTMTGNSAKSDLDLMVQTLKKKQIRLIIVSSLSSLLFFANGVLVLTGDNYEWQILLVDLPDPAQIGFRFLYLLNLILCVYLFQIPRHGDSAPASQKSVRSRSSTTRARADLEQGDPPSRHVGSVLSPGTTEPTEPPSRVAVPGRPDD
jgi:hypothetical protein